MTAARSTADGPTAGGAPKRDGPVVTLDGPAGSGKSTTAREVARRLGLRHLDSGALYRAMTFALLDAAIPAERWHALSDEELRSLGVDLEVTDDALRARVGGRVVGQELRTPEVTAKVSALARLPGPRRVLLDVQRAAGATGRLVADGRDMGTVVFPDADVKVFLVAAVEERARRRLGEAGVPRPTGRQLADEIARISERDRTDTERDLSPLRAPVDARVVDTTALAFDEQVRMIADLARG
jgi:cytidylate kinase